jgi:predicted deacetylase
MKHKNQCRAILRVDDVYPSTTPAELREVYEPCWEWDIPVCLSVVPASDEGDVRGNSALVSFLDQLHRSGLVEIVLHGWQHSYGELARGSVDAIRGRLEAGLAVLRDAWPDMEIHVLVPPHEHLSPAGLAAARQLDLEVCGTWAATHGGVRWAHWWGRLRRWAGWSLAPVRRPVWPTDITLLDFEGREKDDRPATEHHLRLGRRWSTPVVFVQHHWPLSAEGGPRERWLRWLVWMGARPDVRFVRFCDV